MTYTYVKLEIEELQKININSSDKTSLINVVDNYKGNRLNSPNDIIVAKKWRFIFY